MTTRVEMLRLLRQMGIIDERVLAAIAAVDRADFVPAEHREEAYEDYPLPIGFGQTISQPYTVARMLELLVEGTRHWALGTRVLEIGTGSGWQTCLLARLFLEVYTIETVPELAESAEDRIQQTEYRNIKIKTGDGKEGWKEYAPFDGIICGANAREIPEAWIKQLAVGGRMVCPVKGVMTRVTKITNHKLQITNNIQNVRFASTNSKYFRIEEFGRFDFVPLI